MDCCTVNTFVVVAVLSEYVNIYLYIHFAQQMQFKYLFQKIVIAIYTLKLYVRIAYITLIT